MKINKAYLVQIIIDITVIILGLLNYIFPSLVSNYANMIFYLEMIIYAFLELIEYLLNRSRKEPLYLFAISVVASFSGFFLRDYDARMVLSLTIATWILMLGIVKIMALEEIHKKYTNLFMIRLSIMGIFILAGILVSVNLYYRITDIAFMLGLLYLSYGFLELFGDFTSFLAFDNKFIKE